LSIFFSSLNFQFFFLPGTNGTTGEKKQTGFCIFGVFSFSLGKGGKNKLYFFRGSLLIFCFSVILAYPKRRLCWLRKNRRILLAYVLGGGRRGEGEEGEEDEEGEEEEEGGGRGGRQRREEGEQGEKEGRERRGRAVG
jgi:hypothetical protein